MMEENLKEEVKKIEEAMREMTEEATKETTEETTKETTEEATKEMTEEALEEKPEEAHKPTETTEAATEEHKPTEITQEAEPPAGQPDTDQNPSPVSSRKRKIWPAIAVACLFVALIGIYSGVVFYYQTHFLPGTIINGIDCSGMEAEAVTALLDAQIMDYSLEVKGRDYASGEAGAVLGIVSAKDIGLTYEATLEKVEQILQEQDPLLWVTALFPHEYNHDLVRGVTYDHELLDTLVKSWKACQEYNMMKAEDAYISDYSDGLGGYEIIPETSGTELDVEQAIQVVAAAVVMKEESRDLSEAGLYKTAGVTSEDAGLTELVETVNRWLGTKITYDWNGSEVILDIELLKDWVSIVDGEAVIDEEAVTSFVKTQSRANDTYGKNKKFVTSLGIELTLRSPNYGWRTDTTLETEELILLIKEGTVGEREPVYLYTAVQKGKDDIGDSYVEADLTNQHLYLYDDGELILETDFVSGDMSTGKQSPEGVFALTYKTRNATLRGADYESFVYYWMPFYGNYGMHDATWRNVFGGNIYLTDGSHGCINLPLNMAEQIYQYVYKGSPVVCYYYPEPVNPEPATPTEQAPEGQPEEQPGEG